MNEELAARLPDLLPRAIAWAQGMADLATEVGAAVPEPFWAEACRVGIQDPARVRVVVVTRLPVPQDLALRAAALQTGMLGPSMIGLTLGYAVLLTRDGAKSLRLLRHECRHVAQYEAAGGIAAFLPEYLEQIVAYGYQDAPLEIDARAYEGDSGPGT